MAQYAEDPSELDEGDVTCVANRAELLAAQQKANGAVLPCLVVVSGAAVGRMFRLEGTMTLGRAPGVELRLDADGVSRRHARIAIGQDGKAELFDLGSTNGTFVNGAAVERRVLQDGDRIAIGETTILKFSFRDAVEESLQRNLFASATRDGLTGVHNRRWFDEALGAEIAFARRHDRALSLLIVDVDHFKRVNDRFGHPAGDAVLREVGGVLERTVRREDAVARYGGEEFAILLRDTALDAARICAERVREAIERACATYDGRPIPITASVGVATVRGVAASPAALIEAADGALYQAKHHGRNRVEAA